MKSKFCSIFLSFMVILSACQKKKVNVDTVAADLFGDFKEGSYWVYETDSGEIDSSYVSAYSSGYSANTNPLRQSKNCTIESTKPGHKLELDLTREPENTTALILYNSPNGPGFQLSFSNGKIVPAAVYESSAQILTEYRIDNYVFYNVCKIKNTDSTLYVIAAPGVGIIEKKLDPNSVSMKIKKYKTL